MKNVAISLRILGYSNEKEIENRVLYILDKVGMLKFRNRLASQISGGQMQRVAIARAIIKNPNVILADEPTGNLDGKNTYAVMKIIESIAKEKLVILVSHEKHLVKHFADRIIEIKDGVIISDTPNQKSTYDFVDENILLLDEFNEDSKIKSDKWIIDVYSDDHEPKKPYKVTLLVRNQTLYIDLNRQIKNVKILSQDPVIKIDRGLKKEELIEETQSEDLNLSFDLNHKKNSRNKPIESIGKLCKQSFIQLFQMSKKCESCP